MVAMTITAPAPKPAVLSVSTTAEPDQTSPTGVVSFGTAIPRSVNATRSVLVASRQAVPAVVPPVR